MQGVNRQLFKKPDMDTPGLRSLAAVPQRMAARAIATNIMQVLAAIREEEKNQSFLELRYEEAMKRGISVHSAGTYVLDDLFTVLAIYIAHPHCPKDTYREAAIEILAHSRRAKKLGIM